VGECPENITCPTRCIDCPDPAACVNAPYGTCFTYAPLCTKINSSEHVIQCMVTGIYNDEECGALPCPPEGCPSNRFSCSFPSAAGGTKTVCCKNGCLSVPIPIPGQNGVRYCKCPGEAGGTQDDLNSDTGNFCPGTRGCCKPNEYCCGSNCCANGCKDPNQPQLGCACQTGQTACGRHCCGSSETCVTPAVGSPFCCAGTVCGNNCCANGCSESDPNSCGCAPPNLTLPGGYGCPNPVIWTNNTFCMDVTNRFNCLNVNCMNCADCCRNNGGTGFCSVSSNGTSRPYSCVPFFSALSCYSFPAISYGCRGTDACKDVCAIYR
jgi:hypothetical protein